MTMDRKLGAEALGSALLFATVIGSGIMAERLSGGNDGVALLGNTLATVAMLAVLILALGPVSGAHFNPAVTLVMVVRREMGKRAGAAYAVCQLLGGIAGVWLAHAMFGEPLLQVSTHVRSSAGEMLGEGVATFVLLFTILAVRHNRPGALPLAVAAAIAAGYWFTSSTSFANPAITIARAMTDSFAGIAPASVPGFVAAQLAGAVVAQWVFVWLYGRENPA